MSTYERSRRERSSALQLRGRQGARPQGQTVAPSRHRPRNGLDEPLASRVTPETVNQRRDGRR